MQAGDLPEVVAALHHVSRQSRAACGTRGALLVGVELELLAGVNPIGAEAVELLEVIEADAVGPGNFPQGIPAFDDVDRARRVLEAELLPDENPVADQGVEALQLADRNLVVPGNLGQGFAPLHYVDGFV